jgi:hypothetical protein
MQQLVENPLGIEKDKKASTFTKSGNTTTTGVSDNDNKTAVAPHIFVFEPASLWEDTTDVTDDGLVAGLGGALMARLRQDDIFFRIAGPSGFFQQIVNPFDELNRRVDRLLAYVDECERVWGADSIFIDQSSTEQK